MTDQSIGMKAAEAHLSPDAFHMWAQHYFKAMKDFIPPHRFSPVPYFLVCRAMELQLKAFHLKTSTRSGVKNRFWHDLEALYSSLKNSDQILGIAEEEELKKASKLYSGKGFEYFDPIHAMSGYKKFPDIVLLESACCKLLSHGAFEIPPTRIRNSPLIALLDRLRRCLTNSSQI